MLLLPDYFHKMLHMKHCTAALLPASHEYRVGQHTMRLRRSVVTHAHHTHASFYLNFKCRSTPQSGTCTSRSDKALQGVSAGAPVGCALLITDSAKAEQCSWSNSPQHEVQPLLHILIQAAMSPFKTIQHADSTRKGPQLAFSTCLTTCLRATSYPALNRLLCAAGSWPWSQHPSSCSYGFDLHSAASVAV
jgi:hypothetical protein